MKVLPRSQKSMTLPALEKAASWTQAIAAVLGLVAAALAFWSVAIAAIVAVVAAVVGLFAWYFSSKAGGLRAAEIKKRLQHRTISADARQQIVQALAKYPGHKIQVIWFTTSEENINFGSEVAAMMLDADWAVFEAPIQRFGSAILKGVCFSVPEQTSVPREVVSVFENAVRIAIPDLTRCDVDGGTLPFAVFRTSAGVAIESKDVKSSEVFNIWIGSKP